jgi:hypothetical protein
MKHALSLFFSRVIHSSSVVERSAVNRLAVGSIPTCGAKGPVARRGPFFFEGSAAAFLYIFQSESTAGTTAARPTTLNDVCWNTTTRITTAAERRNDSSGHGNSSGSNPTKRNQRRSRAKNRSRNGESAGFYWMRSLRDRAVPLSAELVGVQAPLDRPHFLSNQPIRARSDQHPVTQAHSSFSGVDSEMPGSPATRPAR